MLTCPICQTIIEDPRARSCPLCAYTFESRPAYTALEVEDETDPGAEADFIGGDQTTLIEGEDEEDDDEPREAMILGDFDDANAPPSVVRSGGVLLYATGASSAMLQPWAVPALVEDGPSFTLSPAQIAAVKLIDGIRSAREIHKLSKLKRRDIEAALLTLLDRGVIKLASRPPSIDSPASDELVYPSEMTEDDLGEGSVDHADRIEEEEKRDDTLRIKIAAESTPTAPLPPPAPVPIAVLTPPPAAAPAPVPKAEAKAEAPKQPPKPRLPEMDSRARKLVLQAERDKDAGEFGAALNNLKLALSFDPKNGALEKMLAKLQKEMPRDRPKAQKANLTKSILDDATERESVGDVDGAIEILERALRTHKDPALYNRLGVILATRKKDFARGRELVERALDISPENETYQHNLQKILTHAATADLSSKKGAKAEAGGGLFGLFGKRKP